MPQSLTVLGSGYTAKFLRPFAEQRYAQVLETSRAPEQHLNHLRPDQRIRFDLERSETWRNIPTESDLLWCFPATPLDLVRQFSQTTSLPTRRLVVLGSTSAYDIDRPSGDPAPWIDETAPVDLRIPRVQGEEDLRSTCGAIVLRVSGIYGPGRNPIEWIRTGRVTRSGKYVNLVHVDDLARTCLAALAHAKAHEIYNVSDGSPKTWEEIGKTVEQRWGIRSSASLDTKPTGKRIINTRMCELLRLDGQELEHHNVFDALELIRRQSLNEATPSP